MPYPGLLEQEISEGQSRLQEDIVLFFHTILKRKNEDDPGGTCDPRKVQLSQFQRCTDSFYL